MNGDGSLAAPYIDFTVADLLGLLYAAFRFHPPVEFQQTVFIRTL